MAFENYVKQYIASEFGASAALRAEDEFNLFPTTTEGVDLITPLALAPIPSMFKRRRPSFPLLGKRPQPPAEQQGIVPDYETGDDSFDTVTIEELPESLDSLFGVTGKEGVVKFLDDEFQTGPKVTKSTFGVAQAFDPGYALGQVASMSGTFLPASAAGQKNLEQLQFVQAMAGLGKEGYGIGIVNNQVVGVTPTNIVGTLPNASPKDMDRIRETLTGKSGPMKAGIKAFGDITPKTPVTGPMRKFQDEIIKAKGIPDYLKADILGLGTALNVDFGVNTFKGKLDSRKLVDPTTFIKEYQESTQLGTGDERDDQIDEDTFSDFTAPSLETTTEVDFFSNMPSGGFFSDSDDSYDSGTGDPSGGFGGSSEGDYGFTAYGGKIGMYNGGFASKTRTIKGVGLIKPEQTFMDTDVVDDDIEFPAEVGDYIVNGPTSDDKNREINLLVNYAIDELKKEGVDIRVGNPKIKGENKVPLIVASSETYIPRIIAEKIGYPILDALNDTGKPEVARLKRKLDNEPTDKSKYQANEGMRVGDPRQGFLFGSPRINVTGPSIDKSENVFVPGISDEPVEMKPDDERFFNYYSLRDIKDAIYEKEMKGYEDKGYIFTGVAPDYKNKKSSSAFGKFQITYSTLQDFKDRSSDYKALKKEEKKYVDDLIQQGKDKVNLDLKYGLRRKGKIVPMSRVSGNLKNKLKGLRQGVIPQETHKKYYDKIADLVLRQKLKDYKNKGIRPFLESYGEGEKYGEDVYNILLDKIQIKDLDNNSSATQ